MGEEDLGAMELAEASFEARSTPTMPKKKLKGRSVSTLAKGKKKKGLKPPAELIQALGRPRQWSIAGPTKNASGSAIPSEHHLMMSPTTARALLNKPSHQHIAVLKSPLQPETKKKGGSTSKKRIRPQADGNPVGGAALRVDRLNPSSYKHIEGNANLKVLKRAAMANLRMEDGPSEAQLYL